MGKNLFYDVFDKVQDLEDPLKAETLFDHARELYGLQHVVYAKAEGPFPALKNCYIEGTYSAEWTNHYFANNYMAHDPVAEYGFAETRPFDWRDLPKDDKIPKQIFDEAREFGFGRQGVTIPIMSFDGKKAILNVTSEATDKEWIKDKAHFASELQIIAQFYHHSVASQKLPAFAIPPHNLTDKELECLKWAASGKSVWETSVIGNTSERSVRFHLDQARLKLKCSTKIQAVAKAVARAFINIS